jgi:hypothetical protein
MRHESPNISQRWIKPAETRKCARQRISDVTNNISSYHEAVCLVLTTAECCIVNVMTRVCGHLCHMLAVLCRSEARSMLHGAQIAPLFVPRAYTVLYPRTSRICRAWKWKPCSKNGITPYFLICENFINSYFLKYCSILVFARSKNCGTRETAVPR